MSQPASAGPAPPGFAELAALDEQTTSFKIGKSRFVVAPASPEFLDALTVGDPLTVVPGLCTDGCRGELVYLMRDRRSGVSAPLLRRIGLEVSATLLGVPWWVGWRLASLLQTGWLEHGSRLMLAGVDPLHAPVHRTLSGLYGLLVKNASAEDAAKFDDQLWAIPEHIDPADAAGTGGTRWVRTVSGGRKLVTDPVRNVAALESLAARSGVPVDGFIDG